MLATRLVLARRASVLLAHAYKQPRFQPVHSPSTITTPKSTPWAKTRAFSTQPEQDKQNQHKQTQNNTNEQEEVKEEKQEEEGKTEKEGTESEEATEKKEEDIETPIEEPGWKTARAGTFQQKKQDKQEAKIPQGVAILYWLLGLGGLTIGGYQIYKSATFQYREGQTDPGQLFRKVLEQSIKDITNNQKAIDTFFRSPSVVEEAMANCQVFGNVTTLSFPLLQPHTAARLGTVYVDLVREGDTYEIKSAYVDSVLGKTFDLLEAGIVKPEKYDLFDPEFSAQRTLELMQQAHEQLQQQQALAAQAKAQAQARQQQQAMAAQAKAQAQKQ